MEEQQALLDARIKKLRDLMVDNRVLCKQIGDLLVVTNEARPLTYSIEESEAFLAGETNRVTSFSSTTAVEALLRISECLRQNNNYLKNLYGDLSEVVGSHKLVDYATPSGEKAELPPWWPEVGQC